MNKDFFKKDPYKPRLWDNKTYIFPEEENKDHINKLYTNFLTTGYDEILLEISKNNILNFKTDEGKTLIIAVLENKELSEKQKKIIIEKLIHHKVSINALDKYNRTSLHRSCQMGYNSIIQLLIDKKIIKNELDNDGNAPIHYYIEHFIKDCNDYDVYKPRNDIINPKEQKYADIINYLFNIEIINFLQKNSDDYDKIKELIRLIKYFEINKIINEYDIFKKDIEFNIEEDLIDPDRKNKMFKNFIKLKNNVFKIFEDYNKISYVNDDDWDKLFNQEKENIVETVKKNYQKNSEDFAVIKEYINNMKTSFNNIAETLLLFIYIKKNFKFTVNTYLIDYANNITQSCNNVKTNVLNSLQNDRVKEYSADVISTISTYNSQADTFINAIFKFKEDFDKGMNDIKIELENIRGNRPNSLLSKVDTIKLEIERNSNITKQILPLMIHNINESLNNSIAQTEQEQINNEESIKNTSNNLRSQIDENIKHQSINTNPTNTNIYLPLQIAMQTASAVLLYDASYPLLTENEPNAFLQRDAAAIKNSAEISLKSASIAIFEYIKAYKQSLKANYPDIKSTLNSADRNTFKELAAKKDILLNIFTPAPDPNLLQNNRIDDAWVRSIFPDLGDLNRIYDLACGLTETFLNNRLIDPTLGAAPAGAIPAVFPNPFLNMKMNQIIRIINKACRDNAHAPTRNNTTTISFFSVNSLIKRLLNRPSIRGIEQIAYDAGPGLNVQIMDTIMNESATVVRSATIGAFRAQQYLEERLAAVVAGGGAALAPNDYINALTIATLYDTDVDPAVPGPTHGAFQGVFVATPINNNIVRNLGTMISCFPAAGLILNYKASALAAVVICTNFVQPPPADPIFSIEQAIFIGSTVASPYNRMGLGINNNQRIQIATAIVNHIFKQIPNAVPAPFLFNDTVTPSSVARVARQTAINLGFAPNYPLEIAAITAATAAYFPNTTDIIYRIESEIRNLTTLPQRIVDISQADVQGLDAAKTSYNVYINNAITYLQEIKGLIPLATCKVVPLTPPWDNVQNLANFLQPNKFVGIPAMPPAQLTIENATAVSKAYKDSKDLYKMAMDAKKDLLNAGIAIPNEVDDVIDKAKQLAEEIAKVNLNKAEILEIFAENLFNKIRVLNNTSSDRCRDYSLSLLILSIFINDMQIEKPIDDTYEENFKIVTASINNFYSSSINSFINSIKSKIYYLIVWNNELGFNNVGQTFKALTDQITQLNKEKNLTSEFINSFETQINILIRQNTQRIIYNMWNPAPIANPIPPPPIINAPFPLTAAIINIHVETNPSSEQNHIITSIALLGGLIHNIYFPPFDHSKWPLKNYLFLYFNDLNYTIAGRYNIIQPIYELLLLKQKKKEAWDKTMLELQVLPAEVSKIKVQQGSFKNIEPDIFEAQYNAFKDKIFTNGNFNYSLEDLDKSTKTINNNSIVYYDCKSRKSIQTFIPDEDEACMYEYDKIKSCENEFEDSNKPDKFCADEYAKTNFKCKKYLFNNIQSEFLLKNGIFYLDSKYDTYVNFYDDDDDELSFNYKFLNIHFIFELLDKYLYEIENIDLPNSDDEDYFDNINIKTIFKIYSNYEKIICILNNLNVIYKKHSEINSKLDILKENLFELKDDKQTPYFNYRKNLPEVAKVNAAVPAGKKKKYKIEQHGGFTNYVELFTARIDERITELDKKIDVNKFNAIYDFFKSIMEKYNSIIENIDKKYSLQFLEFIKTSPSTSLPTQYINRFIKLNDINFPANIKLYFENYFDRKGEIKKDEISKLFLILKDINYNEIYNNVAPQLDIKDYTIGNDYLKTGLHYVRDAYDSSKDRIYFDSQDIPDPNDETKPFINEDDNAPDITNKDTFTLGFLNKDKDKSDDPAVLFRKLIDELEKINIPAKEVQRCRYVEQLLKAEPSYIRLTGMVNDIKNDEIDDLICLLNSCDSYMGMPNITALCKSCIEKFDKTNIKIYFKDKTNVKNYFKKIDLEIDLNLFENLCFQRQISYIGQYIYHPNDFVYQNELIILAVYYYNIYINYYINKCKKNYLGNIEDIFTSVKCKFEEEYSGKDRESKKIIKNLNRIIQNKEEAEKLLEMKFYNLLKIIMDHQTQIETNRIIKIIFRGNNDLKDLVEKYSISPETIVDKIKELNTKGRLYLIDQNKEIDNRVFSTKIINKVCLNESFLDKIKDFKFDLRFPDKNGNTVIHRLVDQLNEAGIRKLLNYDKSIATYKNNNNETPFEYLLNIFNIIKNLYKKDEIQKKIDDIASKINEDFHKDNIIRWTEKDTSVIYLNSLVQFNEFIWLNLYQFKNNINMIDITKLKEILKSKNKIKEDLLIRDINIETVKKKLNVIFGNNIKKRFEKSILEKNKEELKILKNKLDNLENQAVHLPEMFNKDEINVDIAEIKKKIDEIKNKKKDVKDFVVILKDNQKKSVDDIICYLDSFKSKFIKKTNINYEEFMEFAKLLDKDYLKLLHLLHDYKKEENIYLFMCDFNYELMTVNINELDKDKKDAYEKYFYNHIDTIIADFNDLDKYEDYTINYINQEILNIIYINMVFTISWEIYNTLLQYLFEKYDERSLKETTKFDSKLVLKNLKLYLKNKIYEILDIKNPLKSYDSLELYKDIIINSFIDFTNKKLEEEDKKKMEQILEYYSRILQTIASRFYDDIKEYIIDQRKIIILLKIYDLLKNYEKIKK